MNTIYYFSTEPEFQRSMETVFKVFRDLQTQRPERLSGINLNKSRVVAAAISIASSANKAALAKLAMPNNLPSRAHREKGSLSKISHKTVHLTPRMLDYLKAGASTLNIKILGPKEDKALKKDPDAGRLRITERQYMHLAILYLAQQGDETILEAFEGSYVVCPFKTVGRPGPNGRQN